jgi:uncharacterized SAM-binding protein YcdF (DUF218 family)
VIGRVIGFLALLWAFGFALFMIALPRPLENTVTDAIVVPTGGPGRIDRGIALIQAHAAKRMLVSGVAQGVTSVDLAREYHTDPRIFACCIDLGTEAVDTRSNGRETADWVREHGYRSVRLVTSDWHVARARLELVHALGDGVKVVGDGVPSSPRLSLLLVEYHKFLLRRAALLLGIDS